MPCDICGGSKKIWLSVRHDLAIREEEGDFTSPSPRTKQFDCPQCAMVPFRRVRASKVTTAYPAEVYGKMQVPIERGLAARFGEYLVREGLIKFTTRGSSDFGGMDEKITITAHLGVVSPQDTKRAEAVPEVAVTAAPPIPERVRRRAKLPYGSKLWKPKKTPWSDDEPVTDEFDEPKDAIANRFSGLEI